MDVLDDRWEDEEEERSQSHCGGGGRFGARWQKPRSKSHHQLLMDSVGNGNGAGVDGDGASGDQEIVPLPEYERLSQSARLPHDPDPKNPLLPEYPAASPPPLPPPMPRQQQKKPAAWRLIEYVRSRNRSSGCSSDGDSRSSDGEKEGDDGGGVEKSKKQRSSWLPDRERRWPVQGFYGGEKEGEDGGGGEEGKKEEKNKKRSSWLPDRERRWPVQGFY